MAYTTINDPKIFFNTVLYSGSNGTQSVTGINFQPDFSWLKCRSTAYHNRLFNSVSGAGKNLISDNNNSEQTVDEGITAFNSDGFSVKQGSDLEYNASGQTYVSWNWLAGGTAPAITYTVKVVSDSGNKYRFDDFGTSAVTLDLQEGGTYTFDQSDSSNSGHPLRFYTASDKSGGEYTTGVTTTGTPGNAGAKTVITVAASAPTLYYQCSSHSAMGGQANTNSTFGSSNFSGSIQSTVSAGSTQGFSIVSYTGTGSSATVGHGLGVAPKVVIYKNRSESQNWRVVTTAIDGSLDNLFLNTTDAKSDDSITVPSSTVFTLDGSTQTNKSSQNIIAYCFAEKKGYSKFGSYTGNGNADGTFIYTGFRPAWVLNKLTSGADDWQILDNKRNTFNVTNKYLRPNSSGAVTTNDAIDFLSNGFKLRTSAGSWNPSGGSFIYMAFAESPFVNSNGVPNNAR